MSELGQMKMLFPILPAAILLTASAFPSAATSDNRWERSYNMGIFAVGVETTGGDVFTLYCPDTHNGRAGAPKVILEAVLSKPLATLKTAAIGGRVEIGTKSWLVPLQAGIDATSVTWSVDAPDALARLGEIVDAIAGHDTIRLVLPGRSLDFPLAGASEALGGMPCLP